MYMGQKSCSLFHRQEVASLGKPRDKSLFPNVSVTFVSYVYMSKYFNKLKTLCC